MRILVLFGLLASLTLAADDPPKAITPAEAAKKVNETITVEMQVKAAALRSNACWLNSMEDYKDAKNFTVYIDKDALAKFKEAKIDNPAEHYKGKTIQVTGKVVLYQERPEIKVTGPDAIKIVEKK